jgi:hypothetical protein
MQRSRIVQTLNVPQRVRLGPSLATALLDSLFKHPAGVCSCCATRGIVEVLLRRNWFSAACEAGNCCYRSFASVASNVFILLRMFSRLASPGHHTGRSDRLLGRVNEV